MLAVVGCGDERFVAVGEDVVRDETTALHWTRRDHDGPGLSWHQAERHCATLALGGWSDWRLPEVGELRGLYDETLESPCGERTCRIPPAIRLDDPYVWSATGSGSSRRVYIDFHFGTTFAPIARSTLVRRVLCVRP